MQPTRMQHFCVKNVQIVNNISDSSFSFSAQFLAWAVSWKSAAKNGKDKADPTKNFGATDNNETATQHKKTDKNALNIE